MACHNLRATLRSLEIQSFSDFSCTIALHESPEYTSELDHRFNFLKSEFPAPSITANYDTKTQDRQHKVKLALESLEITQDDYIMVLDADDLIHFRLFEHVSSANTDAIILNNGYEMDSTSKRLLKRKDMLSRCGSTFLLRGSCFFKGTEFDSNLFNRIWHNILENEISKRRWTKHEVPFPSIIYRLRTGMNISDSFRESLASRLRQTCKFALLGRSSIDYVCKEFGENCNQGIS